MSGSRLNPAGRQTAAADEHLGDRLAALVDGELDHDARERVLAHLATCARCKSEADAQRRLKNVFAEAAPPPPSENFLARLQSLPSGSGGDGDRGVPPFGGTGLDSGRGLGAVRGFGQGVFDVDPEPFGYAPSAAHAAVLPSGRGFRIHEVGRSGRHDGDRASRGRRFAFAAAGAVSLAAVALGGVSTGVSADGAGARGSGAGSNAVPLGSQSAAAVTMSEGQRRRSSSKPSPLLGRGGGALTVAAPGPVTSVDAGGPLLPGGGHAEDAAYPFATPLLSGAARLSPLIRPTAADSYGEPEGISPGGRGAASGLTAVRAALPMTSSLPPSVR
ncbi:anti-sigma factor family protein [Streptomyces beihaiensis]|uniref:Anti-sigma factor n=1 Tax=Streptomyces beihaiensis TaxID=2984495 RepID=A0ABT3TY41_9ACTN|nr:zf-HC2 domain-containing protein [Streptomyces beihaiensis]MCX3060985.1 anti-sigma factor [Streptomyces beihaiensis]